MCWKNWSQQRYLNDYYNFCIRLTQLKFLEVQAGQHEGQFPEDEALMKYHECLLKLAKIVHI